MDKAIAKVNQNEFNWYENLFNTPDFLILFVAIVIKIPSKYDNSNIIFLNVNLIVNKRVRVLIF
jgi:hypothetical protein